MAADPRKGRPIKYILVLYLFHLGEYGPWELYYDDYKTCHKQEHIIEAMNGHGPPSYSRPRVREIFEEGGTYPGILFIPCTRSYGN